MLKKINFKFIGAVLFAVTFFVSGFFINTTEAIASSKSDKDDSSYSISYSMSEVTGFLNDEGGITTIVKVGCAPGSGDIYDINTGNPCIQFNDSMRIGCAPGSNDLYDINTGSPCTNISTPAVVGCAPGSGDIYDITTGKLCLNNTKPVMIGCLAGSGDLYDITNGKPCTNTNETLTAVTSATSVGSTKLANNTIKTVKAAKSDSLSIYSSGLEKEEPTFQDEKENVLTASAGKIGLILHGPMSIIIIILVVIIIIAGGFGIYEIIDKKKSKEKQLEEPKISTPIK